MPGGDTDDRALKTASAVLFFLREGHTPTDGAFRAHVERMVRFLENLRGLPPEQREIVDRVTAFARAGKKPKLAPPATTGIAGRVKAMMHPGKAPKAAEAKSWADVEAAIA